MTAVTPANFTYLETAGLRPAPFLSTFFPAGRDWPLLRESFALYGYRPEYPVVVRRRPDGEGFEIIDGVGRVTLAREAGVERVPAFVRVFEDEQARRFVVDANLYRADTQARVKLVPAIVLAVEHERSGGAYRVERILEVTGVSGATYKRAKAGLNFAVGRLRTEHPELESGTEAEVVAACLTRRLWPEFAQFYSGELEPYGFYKRVYKESSQAIRRRKKAREGDGEQAKAADADLGKPEAGDVSADGKAGAADTVKEFLRLAQGQNFARLLWETPGVYEEFEDPGLEPERLVPFLSDLLGYFKDKLSERKAATKKVRPTNQDSAQILISDVVPNLF